MLFRILTLLLSISSVLRADDTQALGTFSIAALDPETGELGVGVASKFLAVGSLVPYAKAGVGAIATQSLAGIPYGSDGLKLLKSGKSPKEVIEVIKAQDPYREYRQVGMIDAKGNAAGFTGKECKSHAEYRAGKNYAIQGNILTGPEVLDAMAKGFEEAIKKKARLADAILAALKAADDAGGDSRGKQSAAILVVRKEGGYIGQDDRFVDLRVDDDKEPISKLGKLIELHKKTFPHRWER